MTTTARDTPPPPPWSIVLWDFGDTLVDERWMLQAPPALPRWTEVWDAVVNRDLAPAWYRGDLRERDVAAAVAERLPMTTDDAVAHMRRCCTQLRFLDAPWAAARRRDRRQALVTINPDSFSRHVVPHARLHDTFELIVTSWEERTLDKTVLCERALQRLGPGLETADALLVDNRVEHVDSWRSRGGHAFLFDGETRFEAELAPLLRR